MSMLVAPLITTFADGVGLVTGDASVTIGDVANDDFSICGADTRIPLEPSPANDDTVAV